MKRALLTVAATALLVAPSAFAATPVSATTTTTIRGTVVGKDRSHAALLVTSRAGVVRAIRAPRAFARTDIGRRVVVRYRQSGARLPVALGVRRGSEARTAVVRGTIIRVRQGEAVLATGDSALRVSLTTAKRQRLLSSAGSRPEAGDEVELEVEIDDDGSLAATGVSVGNAGAPGAQPTSEGELEVRGTVTAVSPAVIVKTGTGVIVTCVVPGGGTAVGIAAGDLVELKCDLVGGQWVVRKAHGEDEDEEHHARSSEIEVAGTLTSLDPLSVRSASGEVVTCRIPAGTSLAGFVVGQFVELECRTIDGVPTLVRLKAEIADDDDGNDDSEDDDSEDDDSSDGEPGDDD